MVIPFVEDIDFYSRQDSVLIATKTNGVQIPLVKFKQKFIDVTIVGGPVYDYMKKYMETFPELCEIIYPPKINQQLELF